MTQPPAAPPRVQKVDQMIVHLDIDLANNDMTTLAASGYQKYESSLTSDDHHQLEKMVPHWHSDWSEMHPLQPPPPERQWWHTTPDGGF